MQPASVLILADAVRPYGRLVPTFVSADGRLCDVAQWEGLKAVNPSELNEHTGGEHDRTPG